MKRYLLKRKNTKTALTPLRANVPSASGEMLERLVRRLSRFTKHNLILSHTHFLVQLGGTERVIYDQAVFFEKQGIGSIQIYPPQFAKYSGTVGLIVDGVTVGIFPVSSVMDCFKRMQFENVFVHHTFGLQSMDLLRKVAALKVVGARRMYSHDFYIACPQVNLKCLNSHGGKDCSQGPVEGESKHGPFCSQLYTSGCVPEWRKSFRWLIDTFEMIAPSVFLRDKLAKAMGVEPSKFQVVPPIVLNDMTKVQEKRQKLKIAYLGYEAAQKGYDDWLELVANKQLRAICEFIHIGHCKNRSPYVHYYDYEVISDGPDAPIRLLKSLNIDFVVLLSTVPESFSFTLYESLAAQVPILTVASSGNIAAVVESDPSHGICFEDIRFLSKFLLDQNHPRILPKPMGSHLAFNPEL